MHNSKGFLSPSYSARLSSSTSPFRKTRSSTPSSPASTDERLVPNPLSPSSARLARNPSLSKSTSSVRRRILFVDSDDDDDNNENGGYYCGNDRDLDPHDTTSSNGGSVRESENNPLAEYERLCNVIIYDEVFGKENGKSPKKNTLNLNNAEEKSYMKPPEPSNASTASSNESFFAHGPVSEAAMKAISATYSRPGRVIPDIPEKVLHVPGIINDFYLDPLDWSKNNILAILLKGGVYFFDIETSTRSEIFLDEGDETSLKFSPSDPSVLALGTEGGFVSLYDVECPSSRDPIASWETKYVNPIRNLDWSPNGNVLACGTKDGSIGLLDQRSSQKAISLLGDRPACRHKKDVCGLKWNPQGTLIASGGDDSLVIIWDIRNRSTPLKTFMGHESAVRALAWSPHVRGKLVSGGGTTDQSIRFWDTNTLSSAGILASGSQVCGLHWSALADEIVSIHGFSQNHVKVWDAKTSGCIAVLCGHDSRILNLAVSPDGRKILTGSPDEKLCFWNLYPTVSNISNDSFR